MVEALTESDRLIEQSKGRIAAVNKRLSLEREVEEDPKYSREWAIKRALDRDSLALKIESFNSFIEIILSTGKIGTGDELDKYNRELLGNYNASRARGQFIEDKRQHQLYILKQRSLVDSISKYEEKKR